MSKQDEYGFMTKEEIANFIDRIVLKMYVHDSEMAFDNNANGPRITGAESNHFAQSWWSHRTLLNEQMVVGLSMEFTSKKSGRT